MFDAIDDLRAPTSDSKVRHFVVLGPDDVTLFYSWGHYNVIPWEEVLRKAQEAVTAGGFQQSITDISLHRKHVMIDSRPDTYKWGRVRTRYSLDVKQIVRELLRRGIIAETTPVKIGNWASQIGTLVGTAHQVAGRLDIPPRLVLYHGTTDVQFEDIATLGLRPMPLEHRVWKDAGGRRGHPLHREEAVYLTAALVSAEYYARKAVNVLRARGYRGVKPVVLRVRLSVRDFPGLRADDDYLSQRRFQNKPASEEDWFGSLQEFGQVAFLGTIPPRQLEVI
jgi:hypothetical protein